MTSALHTVERNTWMGTVSHCLMSGTCRVNNATHSFKWPCIAMIISEMA